MEIGQLCINLKNQLYSWPVSMFKVGKCNMAMWKIRSCPKCGGDVFLDIDEHIWFDHCLQCGYMRRRSGINCPQCGFEMLLDNNKAGNLYHCSHCGYTKELHHISK